MESGRGQQANPDPRRTAEDVDMDPEIDSNTNTDGDTDAEAMDTDAEVEDIDAEVDQVYGEVVALAREERGKHTNRAYMPKQMEWQVSDGPTLPLSLPLSFSLSLLPSLLSDFGRPTDDIGVLPPS
jgi:hypothetical protein